MSKGKRYSPEVRERAVRMDRKQRQQQDPEWTAIVAIAKKIGCKAETLRL